MFINAASSITQQAVEAYLSANNWLTAPLINFLDAHPVVNLFSMITAIAIMVAGAITIVVSIVYERSNLAPKKVDDYTGWNYATDNPWVGNTQEDNRRPAHADSYDEWAIDPWEVNPWEAPATTK